MFEWYVSTQKKKCKQQKPHILYYIITSHKKEEDFCLKIDLWVLHEQRLPYSWKVSFLFAISLMDNEN